MNGQKSFNTVSIFVFNSLCIELLEIENRRKREEKEN